MYQVLDSGKPADAQNHNVHSSWNKSSYPTFQQAEAYAREWLGKFNPKDHEFRLNEPYNYSGVEGAEIVIVYVG